MIVVALCLTDEGIVSFNLYNKDNERNDGDGFCPVVPIRCDVTSEEDVAAMKALIRMLLSERNAVLYAIINNAGIADPGNFIFYRDLTIPKKVMDVNYFGQLAVTQALLPMMLSTSAVVGGKIINMSSVCGTQVTAGNSTYASSKFAIEAWSDALRLELEHFNIEVTKIRPGQINTAIQSDWHFNYLKNYKSSPEQILALYGREKFVENFPEPTDSSSITQPSVVVDTLTEVLRSKAKLEPYYLIGTDAHTFFKAISNLPVPVSDMIKKIVIPLRPEGPKPPPLEKVAHVTICVRNIETSLQWYKVLGFETVGPREGDCQFIRLNSSNNRSLESLVLLKEDKAMLGNGKSSDLLEARIAICTDDIQREADKIKTSSSKEGGSTEIKPIDPININHKNGEKFVAYEDPDGSIVYFVEFSSIATKLNLWWHKVKMPFLCHWTRDDQIFNDLRSAFNITPIVEWVSPKSSLSEASASYTMTLSVTDVRAALDKAKQIGMIVDDKDALRYEMLPFYGQVLAGKAHPPEKGSCTIKFCCFSNQMP